MAAGLRLPWDTTFRLLAATLSAGAALVSILTYVRAHAADAALASAVLGGSPESVLAGQVDRVAVTPRGDTAYSLGDTLRLAAMAVDPHGLALIGARVQWQTEDSSVAVVDSSGEVIARGPGVTSVTVAAGDRSGRARIWVLPRVASLELESDSVIRMPESQTAYLGLVARDARGNRIPLPAPGPVWTVADREVAVPDSTGQLRALSPGRTLVSATLGSLVAQGQVEVVAVPASITLNAGGDQRATAGERLPLSVSVQVVSRSGRPVPGAVVRFDALPSGGRAEPDSARTDNRGQARSAWTLGRVPGRQRLTVQVPGIDSPLVLGAESDPIASHTRIRAQPDSLTALVGSRIGEALAVQVVDTTGAALPDVPVTWSALDGGTVVATEVRTDTLGMARAHWTLGPKAGRQRARAQVGNPRSITPITVVATATAGPAVRLRVVAGDHQRGTAGAWLATTVVLQAEDSLGNPVAGVPLRLMPASGSVSDSTPTTDGGGRSRVRWTLAGSAGENRLAARMDKSTSGVELTATGTAGSASQIRLTGPAAGATGTQLPKPIGITVLDRFGNPVAGTAIALSASGGKVSPNRVITDRAGAAQVQWTLGGKTGGQSLSAQIKGGPQAKHVVTVAAATKTTSKPAVKPAAKPAAKPATKPAVKPAAKPGAKPSPRG